MITPDQLKRAEEIQRKSGERLGEVLIRSGYLSEEMLVGAIASRRGVQPWDLRRDPPSPEALRLVPFELCREHLMLPVQVRGDLLLLAMADPTYAAGTDAARKASGLRVEAVLTHEDRLRRMIDQLAEGGREVATLDELVNKAMSEVREGRFEHHDHAELGEADVRPVVGLVNQILSDAIRMRASDIHLEPRNYGIDVRFRLDGRLVKVSELPVELLPMLVARVKILAELDVVEYRTPQDGRITAKFSGRTVDMRVSVLPNLHGQRVVMRLLDRSAALRSLDTLGFDEHNLDILRRLARKPYGMVLVTGPTGSGKTTTLYAALNEVKSETTNIMTAEDPVEYDIPGINQSQVYEKVGLTFAEQLRAILRQDPDIVLVGEIRDEETAEIALRASMTGHLVLSTLHTNDALSAIPRLVDIGIRPHLLGTSLIGVLAQRLVRVLCPDCKAASAPTPDESRLLEAAGGGRVDQVWRPVGCDACYQTGYRGREAISEIMPISHVMSRLIAAEAPLEEVREHALKVGYRPMQWDAARRVAEGTTSFEEAASHVFFEDFEEQSPGTISEAA